MTEIRDFNNWLQEKTGFPLMDVRSDHWDTPEDLIVSIPHNELFVPVLVLPQSILTASDSQAENQLPSAFHVHGITTAIRLQLCDTLVSDKQRGKTLIKNLQEEIQKIPEYRVLITQASAAAASPTIIYRALWTVSDLIAQKIYSSLF
jgi:hypothetical protein